MITASRSFLKATVLPSTKPSFSAMCFGSTPASNFLKGCYVYRRKSALDTLHGRKGISDIWNAKNLFTIMQDHSHRKPRVPLHSAFPSFRTDSFEFRLARSVEALLR
jgi:hypothetical protein